MVNCGALLSAIDTSIHTSVPKRSNLEESEIDNLAESLTAEINRAIDVAVPVRRKGGGIFWDITPEIDHWYTVKEEGSRKYSVGPKGNT